MFVLSNVIDALKEKVISTSEMTIVEFLQSRDFIVFLVASIIGYVITKNTTIAVTVGFTVIISLIVVPIVTKESFELIYPGPDSAPSCMKIKKEDLLKHFEGKETKLKEAMVESQVPYNVELNDTNAPYIASFLINNPKINSIGDCRLVM